MLSCRNRLDDLVLPSLNIRPSGHFPVCNPLVSYPVPKNGTSTRHSPVSILVRIGIIFLPRPDPK